MKKFENENKIAICIRDLTTGKDSKFITLPVADVEELNPQQHECIVVDYEAPFNIKDYQCIEELNDMAEALSEMDDTEAEIISVLINAGWDIDNAMGKVENGDYILFYDCNDMSDVAYQSIEENGIFSDVPDVIKNYFDYEAYGRDMKLEGDFYYINSIDGYVEIF